MGCFQAVWELNLDHRYSANQETFITLLLITHFDDLDSCVLAVLALNDMRSDGRAGFEVKAYGTLSTVTKDLGEEAGWPSVGEIG